MRLSKSRTAACLTVVALLATACATETPEAKLADRASLQSVVDGAAETVTAFRTGDNAEVVNKALADARGVLVYPKITRAALLGGGAGGFGVLVGRSAEGAWSSPAFMSYGGATFGLQAGVDTASVMAVIRNEQTLQALAEGKQVFGGSANVVAGESATQQPASISGADVVVFTRALAGAYAGVNLGSGVVDPANDRNANYYGQPATAVEIAVKQKISSPDAAGLKAALSR